MKTFKERYQDKEFREKHLAHMSQKILCVACGKEYTYSSISRHEKTALHKAYAEQLPNKKNKVATRQIRTPNALSKIGELMEYVKRIEKQIQPEKPVEKIVEKIVEPKISIEFKQNEIV